MTRSRMSRTRCGERLARHGIWAAPIVVFAGAVSYFLFFVRFPDLRDVPWVNAPWVGLGLVWAVWSGWTWLRQGPGIWRRVAAGGSVLFSLAVGGLFLWYVFVFSYDVPTGRPDTLAMEAAPDFSLPDQDGREVHLNDFQGRKVVLVFYRGHW